MYVYCYVLRLLEMRSYDYYSLIDYRPRTASRPRLVYHYDDYTIYDDDDDDDDDEKKKQTIIIY
jgi:hypothetical protein